MTGPDPFLAALRDFAAPLAQAATGPDSVHAYLRELGWDLNALGGAPVDAVTAVFTAGQAAVTALESLLGNGTPDLDDFEHAASAVQTVVRGARALATSGWRPPSGLPDDLVTTLADDLLTDLAARWLLGAHPRIADAFEFMGVFVPPLKNPADTPILEPETGAVIRTAGPRPRLDAAALDRFVTNPVATLRERFDSTAADLSQRLDDIAGALWPAITSWLAGAGVAAISGVDPRLLSDDERLLAKRALQMQLPLSSDDSMPPVAAQFSSGAIMELTGEDLGTVAIAVGSYGRLQQSWTFGSWTVDLDVSVLPGTVVLSRNGVIGLDPADTTASGSVTLRWAGPDALSAPSTTGTRVTFDGAALSIAITAGTSHAVVSARATTGPSRLVVDTRDADSFIAQVLPGPITAPFELEINWNSDHGATVKGAIPGEQGVDIAVPISVTLPAAHLDGMHLSIVSGGGPAVAVDVSGGIDLGPLHATVQRLGLQGAIALPSARGDSDTLRVTLRPPDGISLAIDAPLVSGSGYLACDPTAGRYAGAVSVRVGNLSVQGVGVLNTKNSAGGWSLVALAEVSGLSIQLGFGIELTGLGVLVGIHRTIDVQAIRALARAGGLDTLMFPPDLSHNAAHAASALEAAFPAASGQYIFGPTAQLAWGGEGQLTAELAVYVELPTPLRILLLGSAHLTLPTAKAPVVDILLDLLGVLDLTNKTLAIDMSLGHSTIAGMPLAGQAALRAAWGANPVFVLAIGGCHPHFTAPPGFPQLNRVTLQIGGGDVSVTLTAYLALTSNTVQFGARVDLRAAAAGAALTATVSFDALVQFSPFHLEVDLHISATLSFHGAALAGLSIDVHLSGPGPWHLTGSAHVTLLFLSITIPISGTFGSAISAPAPAPYDPFPDLVAAVADIANWTIDPPPGTPALTLCGGLDRTVLHPCSDLTVRQQMLPLDIAIDRIGTRPLPGPTTYRLSLRGGLTGRPVTAPFARAQYTQLTDAEKLSSPSFDPLEAGLQIIAPAITIPIDQVVTTADITVTPKHFDRINPAARNAAGAATGVPATALAAGPVVLPSDLLETQLDSAAAAVNTSRRTAFPGGGFLGVSVRTPNYTLTEPTTSFTSYSAAAVEAQTMPDRQVRFLSELQAAGPSIGTIA